MADHFDYFVMVRIAEALEALERPVPQHDEAVAQIAGNILSGHPQLLGQDDAGLAHLALGAVWLARAIIAETKRTEPPALMWNHEQPNV